MRIRAPNADFEAVKAILAERQGHAQAITIDNLAILAGFLLPNRDDESVRPDRRRCELVLQTRRGDFPFPVISCARGIYRVRTAVEANAYLSSMLSRHAEMSHTMTDVRAKLKAAGFIQEEPWRFSDPPSAQGELPFVNERKSA